MSFIVFIVLVVVAIGIGCLAYNRGYMDGYGDAANKIIDELTPKETVCKKRTV